MAKAKKYHQAYPVFGFYAQRERQEKAGSSDKSAGNSEGSQITADAIQSDDYPNLEDIREGSD